VPAIFRFIVATVGYTLFVVMGSGAAFAATVFERSGDIYFSNGSGVERRLTSTGGNTQPTLSGDGLWVAYVHVLKPSAPPLEFGASELWLTRADGQENRRLVASSANEDPKQNLSYQSHPAFSPSGKILYFMATAWATSDAIHSLDIASGQERFVCDGNSLEVVPGGRFSGYLMVQKHKYRPSGPAYDDYWLVTPLGKEIRRLGATEGHVARFLAKNRP
jgi:hypothetical protein